MLLRREPEGRPERQQRSRRRTTGCTLSRKAEVPAGKKTHLRLVVAHDPRGDWTLIVKAGGVQLARQKISKSTAKDGWLNVDVDLSSLAGKTVNLELINQADAWSWEAGYWAEIAVESK